MFDIENLTLKQINEIKNINSDYKLKPHPYIIGKNYFIRTVTYFFTGKLTNIYENELVLSDAAWIPDTGAYSNSFDTGIHEEVEPLNNPIIINRLSIIDVTEWLKDLPRKQK